jgi:hypothetical protein
MNYTNMVCNVVISHAFAKKTNMLYNSKLVIVVTMVEKGTLINCSRFLFQNLTKVFILTSWRSC